MKNLIPIFSLLFLIICWSGCENSTKRNCNGPSDGKLDCVKPIDSSKFMIKTIDLGTSYYQAKLTEVSNINNDESATLSDMRTAIFYLAQAASSSSKSIRNSAKSYLTNYSFINKLAGLDSNFLVRPYYSFLDDVSSAELREVGNYHSSGGTDYYMQPFIQDPQTQYYYNVYYDDILSINDISSISIMERFHPIPLYKGAGDPSIMMVHKDSWNHYYDINNPDHTHSTTINSISDKFNSTQLNDFKTIVERTLEYEENHPRGTYHFHDPCRVSYSQQSTLSFDFVNKEILIRDNTHPLFGKRVPMLVQPPDCARFAGTTFENLPEGSEIQVKLMAFTMFQKSGNGVKLMPVEYIAYDPDEK